MGPQRIRFGLVVTADGAGWKGKFSQPDQGVAGIGATVVAEADGVKIALAGVGGKPTMEGRMDAAGKVAGSFTQGAAKGTFEMSRGTAQQKRRPQEPVPPFPYREEEVRVAVKAGVSLGGTLTLPGGDKPERGWPAVVLVTGSGPQNRDEELMGHRPFAVLADRLARKGIVVLRYDDRGVGMSTGTFAGATTKDFAEDGAAAVKWLRGRAEVREGGVGILGHSEGGLVGPMVAAGDDRTAFVVMLAGPGVRGRELMGVQYEKSMLAMGIPEAVVKRQAVAQGKALDSAMAGDEAAAQEAMVDLILMQSGQLELEKVPAEARAKVATSAWPQVANLMSPWMRGFLLMDPREALRRVKCPVLAVNGTLDTQVDAGQNLPEVEKALREGGNADVTVRTFEGLNHLFQAAKTGSVSEYAMIEETMNEEVMEVVAEWILGRFGK